MNTIYSTLLWGLLMGITGASCSGGTQTADSDTQASSDGEGDSEDDFETDGNWDGGEVDTATNGDGDSETDISSDEDSDGSSDGDSDADGDGDSDADSDSDSDADSDADSDSDSDSDGDAVPHLDRLKCTYETISDDGDEFEGRVTLSNANEDYVWNGWHFVIWSLQFITSSDITFAQTEDWIPVAYTKDDMVLTFDLRSWYNFPLGQTMSFIVRGKKQGKVPFPIRCTPRYIRGDIIYPVYEDLPSSWHKGKESLATADLIEEPEDYYKETAEPITEGMFVYDPPHDTQIQIGLPNPVKPEGGFSVNGYDNLRIWIPSRMLAMGIGFAYQWFKFNPNYPCSLGTKENFSCGLIPRETLPNAGIEVEYEGELYAWYYTNSPDGPFQQEGGNFIDMGRFFPDFFPPGNEMKHDEYTHVDPLLPEDPKWATSVITSALSSVVTRETMWAAVDKPGSSTPGAYSRMVFEANDPWAEMAIVTITYNLGIFGGNALGILKNTDALVASNDVINDFSISGNANHVPITRLINRAMNNETENIYDVEIPWSEVETFFNTIRVFYDWGVPTDAEWALMLEDIHRGFTLLAGHWGGDTIRYRYDFLTLLRIAEAHLPGPTVPRPTSAYWHDRVGSLN